MPYYIYRIVQRGPIKQLEKLAQFAAFKEASSEAKRLRQENNPEGNPAPSKIQVIFGENELQAEEALNTLREPQPLTGEDS